MSTIHDDVFCTYIFNYKIVYYTIRDRAHASPSYQKLCARGIHVRDSRRGQPDRCTVQWSSLSPEEPPQWSRLTSTPGKYADGWCPGPLYATRGHRDRVTRAPRHSYSDGRPQCSPLDPTRPDLRPDHRTRAEAGVPVCRPAVRAPRRRKRLVGNGRQRATPPMSRHRLC